MKEWFEGAAVEWDGGEGARPGWSGVLKMLALAGCFAVIKRAELDPPAMAREFGEECIRLRGDMDRFLMGAAS